jgi:hypothetical protein
MNLRKTAVGAALTALVLAGSAQAATPKLANKLIVPNKSVGALKLGQSAAAAKTAWGNGACLSSGLCTFGKRPTPASGYASYSLASVTAGAPKAVATIWLEVGPFGAAKLNYKTPLTKFKTSKGIGLGSTKAQLLHAYPHMTSEQADIYIIPDSETVETIFGIKGGRVYLIAIGEHG